VLGQGEARGKQERAKEGGIEGAKGEKKTEEGEGEEQERQRRPGEEEREGEREEQLEGDKGKTRRVHGE
jgi:hypothetical protein